jgi:hypothetical protein
MPPGFAPSLNLHRGVLLTYNSGKALLVMPTSSRSGEANTGDGKSRLGIQ